VSPASVSPPPLGVGSMTAQMVDICLVLALDVLPKLEEEAKGRMLAGKADPTQIIAEGEAREKAAQLTATNRR